MTDVPITEFRAHVARALAKARRGPVTITSRGRPAFVLRKVSPSADEPGSAMTLDVGAPAGRLPNPGEPVTDDAIAEAIARATAERWKRAR